MVFSSLSFIIIFLPIVLLFYYLFPKKYRNFILLIFSLLFYYIGEQRTTIIMLLSSFLAYISGLLIDKSKSSKRKKLILIVFIILDIAFLVYFKYFNFLLECINQIFNLNYEKLNIILPIGISFYTFQSISYVIDIYRGSKVQKNYINFATYLTFFPQLIAGPIVRYEDISKELTDRKFDSYDFAFGIKRFCFGLAKKVLLSNVLAEFIAIYTSSNNHTVLMAWTTGLVIPLQIYFDFSGYSDMAIGLGRMFGFHFIENFNYPLIAKSATEFWRRWHISLGTWFRDYIYIPLGGNRVKVSRHILNILIVWFLTGLWHGAAYNFIIWGLYYAVLLILEKYVYDKFLAKHSFISYVYFVIITIVGFEIFNASSLSSLSKSFLELFGIGTNGFTNLLTNYYIKSYIVVIILSLICATPLFKKISILKQNKIVNKFLEYAEPVTCILLLTLCLAYLVDGSYNPFLYFRF
jgi:alginate O-acetyltransferase complex protein AlgI